MDTGERDGDGSFVRVARLENCVAGDALTRWRRVALACEGDGCPVGTPRVECRQYYKVDYRELFAVIEPIFWKYDGRPHWGKLHTLEAEDSSEIYPQWDAFQDVHRRLDPKGKFLNAHLRRCFEAA